MAEVLSQDEIDEMLKAFNSGDTEPKICKPAAVTRRIKIYDFMRPDKFSKEELRTISIIHEIFARLTTKSLMMELRSTVHVQVASVDQITYNEFIRSIPTPTTFAIINMDTLHGNAILEIDPEITFFIIDRLLGGTGAGTEFKHELTDIEAYVMEGIIVRMLENIQEAWNQIIDLQPQLGQIETNPQFAQVVPPSDMVLLVTLETKINDVEGMINICFPYYTIESIIDKISAYPWYDSIRSNKYYTLVNREDIPIKLTVEILRRYYPLGEIKKWKEETILLPLCPLAPSHCYLKLGDRRVWQCRIMDDEKWFHKKIVIIDQIKMPFGTEDRSMEMNNVDSIVENALEMAKMRVSVELGFMTLTVKEVFSISEGTILELNKLAGEPLDVKANGVLIAKGEAVVVEDYFGVRILEIENGNSLQTPSLSK